MHRRQFLQLAATPLLAQQSGKLPIRRAVEFSMLPKSSSIAERFQIAKDAGFEQVECPTTPDQNDADAMKKASDATGLKIHSVMNMDHWKYPLSSSDPQVVAKCRQGMETSLRNAHFWGAETVLLVPAVVDAKTGYRDAYERSQKEIRAMIPMAQQLKVIIGVEEVWNKFLLSPLEFAKYIDEFNSPWVRAYFDVGNVALFSYPQDWIRILNKRIVKLHIKDFSFKKRVAEFTDLREGEIDWKAIYAALKDINYQGTATVELHDGNPAYLKEVNHRFEMILNGTA